MISAPVYAELMANPARSQDELDRFISNTGIFVEWSLDEDVWREAGRAYRGYAQRRIRSSSGHPRRILADFIIGARALVRGYTLLTFDRDRYAAAFPQLRIVSQ
jgi:hypothetical protein